MNFLELLQNNQGVRLLRLLLLGNKTRTKKKINKNRQWKIKFKFRTRDFSIKLSPSLPTCSYNQVSRIIDSSKSTPLNQFTQQHLEDKNVSYPKIIGEPINSSLVSGSWDGEVVTTIKKLRHEISVTSPMTNSAQN